MRIENRFIALLYIVMLMYLTRDMHLWQMEVCIHMLDFLFVFWRIAILEIQTPEFDNNLKLRIIQNF